MLTKQIIVDGTSEWVVDLNGGGKQLTAAGKTLEGSFNKMILDSVVDLDSLICAEDSGEFVSLLDIGFWQPLDVFPLPPLYFMVKRENSHWKACSGVSVS